VDLARALRDVYGEPARPARIEPLAHHASNRRYHRLHLPGRTPSTIVAMELLGDPSKPEEVTAGAAPDELPFVHVGRFLASRGVAVPAIHAVDMDAGVVLLEDLGDETLEARLLATPESEWDAPYAEAIDLLAAFQRATEEPDLRCVAYGRGFDEPLLRWELDHFREWGLDAARRSPVPPAARRELDDEFDRLAARIARLPRRLVHRDWQSRNLLFTRRGLVVIDFQDALQGPRVYDLVALLCDSYVDVKPPLRDRLVSRFASALEVPIEGMADELHLVAVQRKLKDAGRFVFIDRVKKNASFLPHVPHSLELVRRSLAASPDLARLRALLADLLPDPFARLD
jgi:hypothetical protein